MCVNTHHALLHHFPHPRVLAILAPTPSLMPGLSPTPSSLFCAVPDSPISDCRALAGPPYLLFVPGPHQLCQGLLCLHCSVKAHTQGQGSGTLHSKEAFGNLEKGMKWGND